MINKYNAKFAGFINDFIYTNKNGKYSTFSGTDIDSVVGT